jgi:single-strand DNA-binding protein
MNTVNLIGNVSKVPHFIAGNESKKAVAYLTVANNDVKEKTIFVEVTVFGREAEYVNQNISTGARIAIEGKIAIRPKKTKNGDTYNEQYISCNRLTNLSNNS